MDLKLFYSILLITIAHGGKAFSQDSIIDLRTCIVMALKSNPQLKQNQLSVRRGEIEYRQAWQNQLPTLNGDLSHGFNQGRNIDPTTNQFIEENSATGNQSLNAGVSLFNGFRILHDIRMKSNAKEAGKLEFEGKANELRLDVIETYIQVLTAKDLLIQSRRQLTVTEEQLRRAEVMFKEGAFAPGDYYDIKGQYKMDQNSVQANIQILYTNRLRLAKLLNIPESELGELKTLPIPTIGSALGWEQLYTQAQILLPDYRALDWRIKEAQQNIKVAKSYYYPSLSLGAGLNSRYSSNGDFSYWQQSRNNLGKSVFMTLSIPIFNQFQVRNQESRAKIGLEENLLQKEIALNNLRESTARAVFDLRVALESVQNLKEQEQSYAESFRIAQVQFDEGASNSFLYLTAKNKLDAARNQLLLKQYAYLLQKYMNDYYAGNLDL
ncbi:TolC family protein [Sphingobacterium olei]|nr:TolC family protein [Sphingobacterium olei]